MWPSLSKATLPCLIRGRVWSSTQTLFFSKSLTLKTGDGNDAHSGSLPLLHLICPFAHPPLWITLSICVSEHISMLASLCHSEQTATVAEALEDVKRRELGVNNTNNKKNWELLTKQWYLSGQWMSRRVRGRESCITNGAEMKPVYEWERREGRREEKLERNVRSEGGKRYGGVMMWEPKQNRREAEKRRLVEEKERTHKWQ